MSHIRILLTGMLLVMTAMSEIRACSVFYCIDPHTGNIYVANKEDYWYDADPYIEIMPGKKGELARLLYGWDREK